MEHTIYKITNNINGKIYIGAHSTRDINDLYYGSGVAINKAIEKYGKDNFSKEILFILKSKEEMYEKEKEIVSESFVQRRDTYNLKIGGFGGFNLSEEAKQKGLDSRRIYFKNNSSVLKGIPFSDDRKKECSLIMLKYYSENGCPTLGVKKSKEHCENMSKAWTIERREKQSENLKVNNPMNNEETRNKMIESVKEWYKNNDNPFLGKTHTDEVKERISKANKGRKFEIVKCPHCDNEGAGPNMVARHFSNCKDNPNKENIKEHKKRVLTKITCPHCEKSGCIANMKRYHFDNCKLK